MLIAMASQYAAEMWPSDSSTSLEATELAEDSDNDEADDDEDIEKQIAKEMSTMKRPRKETRFGRSASLRAGWVADWLARIASCQTNTSCCTSVS